MPMPAPVRCVMIRISTGIRPRGLVSIPMMNPPLPTVTITCDGVRYGSWETRRLPSSGGARKQNAWGHGKGIVLPVPIPSDEFRGGGHRMGPGPDTYFVARFCPALPLVPAHRDCPGARGVSLCPIFTSPQITAAEAAELAGVSRATAQPGSAALASRGLVQVRLRYGYWGRPEPPAFPGKWRKMSVEIY